MKTHTRMSNKCEIGVLRRGWSYKIYIQAFSLLLYCLKNAPDRPLQRRPYKHIQYDFDLHYAIRAQILETCVILRVGSIGLLIYDPLDSLNWSYKNMIAETDFLNCKSCRGAHFLLLLMLDAYVTYIICKGDISMMSRCVLLASKKWSVLQGGVFFVIFCNFQN